MKSLEVHDSTNADVEVGADFQRAVVEMFGVSDDVRAEASHDPRDKASGGA